MRSGQAKSGALQADDLEAYVISADNLPAVFANGLPHPIIRRAIRQHDRLSLIGQRRSGECGSESGQPADQQPDRGLASHAAQCSTSEGV